MLRSAPHRSPRAWLPAAVASVLFALTLVGLQALFHYAFEERPVPERFESGPLAWLLRSYAGFWGAGAFGVEDSRVLLGGAAGGAVLLVLVLLVGWVGVRGLAPGSSAVSAFLVLWSACVVAAPVAQLAILSVRYQESFAHQASGQLVAGATTGAVYGFKWGWAAALAATLVWVRTRPRPSHISEPAAAADRASDSLPGGVPSDAGPGAPMQSRSSRVEDPPGEAVAEGPGRQPR